MAERCRLRARLAAEVSPEAEQAARSLLVEDVADRFALAGTELKSVFVGNPPRWRDNPTNNPEFNAELNRMFHWERLARAYASSGTTAYADQIDPDLANLRVRSVGELELSSHLGRVSYVSDSAHPSTRLCFADKGGPSRRVCSTCLLPRPADATAWPVFSVVQESSDLGVRLVVQDADRQRVISWSPGHDLSVQLHVLPDL